MDHIGVTVPDIEQATDFFAGMLGCKVLYDVGPFIADDDWMQDYLLVHPRSVIRKLRMLDTGNGTMIELFEYQAPDQKTHIPANSDFGASHIGLYVEDMDAAVRYLRDHSVKVLKGPVTMTEGPSAGLTWIYFLAPWGMQLELVSYPNGLACDKTVEGASL
ncbi:VOC family protein [Rhizobium sp. AN80A]|uniref:VOC family protein n=1 Tax=Rhizobium sp. AN80A TaxID=3040673 RepID=UPI0024B3942C|nr:VOC family protein [Rhizobium sp. AN80A]